MVPSNSERTSANAAPLPRPIAPVDPAEFDRRNGRDMSAITRERHDHEHRTQHPQLAHLPSDRYRTSAHDRPPAQRSGYWSLRHQPRCPRCCRPLIRHDLKCETRMSLAHPCFSLRIDALQNQAQYAPTSISRVYFLILAQI